MLETNTELNKLEINIGSTLSFMTFGSVLPNFTNVTLIGSYASDGLKNKDTVIANAINIFPTLPSEIQSKRSINYEDLKYLCIRTRDKQIYEVAYDWVIPTSIVSLDLKRISIIVEKVTSEDTDLIVSTLKGLGFEPTIVYS